MKFWHNQILPETTNLHQKNCKNFLFEAFWMHSMYQILIQYFKSKNTVNKLKMCGIVPNIYLISKRNQFIDAISIYHLQLKRCSIIKKALLIKKTLAYWLSCFLCFEFSYFQRKVNRELIRTIFCYNDYNFCMEIFYFHQKVFPSHNMNIRMFLQGPCFMTVQKDIQVSYKLSDFDAGMPLQYYYLSTVL